jgi:hypothetical protein
MRKVRPKQTWKPPTAAEHNATAAAVAAYQRGSDRPPERQQPVETDVIMVRNASGTDKRRGDVLAVTKTRLLTTLTREHPWITATGLGDANRNYILCVLLDPLPAGKIGPAQISGVSLAYVNVIATWHRRAFPYGGSTVQSGLFGPMELLNAPTVTGEQLCHIKIGHADNRSVVAKVGRSGIPAARRGRRCLMLGSGPVSLYGPTGFIGQQCLLTDAWGRFLTVTAYNATCESIEANTTVRLEPSDDWLPLALDPSCDESSSSSDSSSDDSSSDSSSDSSDSSDSSSDDSRSDSSSDDSSSDSTSDSTSASDSDSNQPPSDSGSDAPPSDSGSESPCPCNGTCLYSGGSGVWYLLEDGTTCAAPCYCEPPGELPDYTGQIVEGTCWGPCDESSDSSSDQPPSDSGSDQRPSDSGSDEPPSDSDDSNNDSNNDSNDVSNSDSSSDSSSDQPPSDSSSDSSDSSGSDGNDSDNGVYDCAGDCWWTWNGSSWDLTINQCYSWPIDGQTCTCNPPISNGWYVGQQASGGACFKP